MLSKCYLYHVKLRFLYKFICVIACVALLCYAFCSLLLYAEAVAAQVGSSFLEQVGVWFGVV